MKIKNLGVKLDFLAWLLILSAFAFSIFSEGGVDIISWQAWVYIFLFFSGLIIIIEISPRVKKKRGEKIFNSPLEVIQHYWLNWYKRYLKYKQKLKKFEEG